MSCLSLNRVCLEELGGSRARLLCCGAQAVLTRCIHLDACITPSSPDLGYSTDLVSQVHTDHVAVKEADVFASSKCCIAITDNTHCDMTSLYNYSPPPPYSAVGTPNPFGRRGPYADPPRYYE